VSSIFYVCWFVLLRFRHVMLCCVVLCYVMLCYVMLCYVIYCVFLYNVPLLLNTMKSEIFQILYTIMGVYILSCVIMLCISCMLYHF
jgi:hypothetical protein